MQIKMVNPEIKQIYKNVAENNKEDKKQLSQQKPFQNQSKMHQSGAKQQSILANLSKASSDRSTQQSITNQQQLQPTESRELNEVDAKSVDLQSTGQDTGGPGLNAFQKQMSQTTKLKLNEIIAGEKPQLKQKERTQPPPIKFDRGAWRVNKNTIEQNAQQAQQVQQNAQQNAQQQESLIN